MKKIIRLVAILPFLLILLAAYPVSATEPPTSDPSVTNIKANINLIETGDVLIYGEYTIPYTSIPPESADDTYSLRLIDTDGETQLGAISIFPMFDNGYNMGLFAFYFTAADNITIDQAYTIRISQSPSHFDDPQSYGYNMPLASWTSKTSQEENQSELTINLITIIQRVSLAHNVELLEGSAGGTVLTSPAGETYLRGAIYGIQLMAPSFFLVQILSYEISDRVFTTDEFDQYRDQFTGEWLGDSTENVSATFGMTGPAMMTLIVGLPIFLGMMILSAIKFRKTDPGLMAAGAAVILLALMGWLSPALFGLIYQVMAIYIGYLLFYARST